MNFSNKQTLVLAKNNKQTLALANNNKQTKERARKRIISSNFITLLKGTEHSP